MESFCQRGTTNHVLPSTLTHDPVSCKRMSISHNLFTLIELLKNQQTRTNPEIFIATGQKLQIWPKRGDVGQSGILKHKRGIVCPSHYGF